MGGIAFGRIDDSFSVASLKACLAEFFSTHPFVFAGVGSVIAYNKLTSNAALNPAGLVAVAICHGFALFVAVSVGPNISSGHVNPAVTLGLVLGGHVTILTRIFYWIVACFLLRASTDGLITSIHSVGSGVGAFKAVVMEIVIIFALVYTVYATAVDPKKGSLGTIAPLAIGFVVGANILAAGPFSGASMNPARSFGPAVASGDFKDIWIYRVGPLIGGGLGGLIYGNVFINHEHAPLSSEF